MAMTERRQLRLGAFMRPVSIHTAWWRYPGAYPDANFNFRHITRFIQTLERGKWSAASSTPSSWLIIWRC
jgi:alkanesulfonate monooxygenase